MSSSRRPAGALSSPPPVLPEFEFEAERLYWLRQLDGVDPLGSSIPADFTRMSSTERPSRVVRRALDEASAPALWRLSDREPVRLYCLLLAAVKLCLFRYLGTKELALGVPTLEAAGPPELARLNRLLLVRSTLSGTMTVAELVDQVRRVLSEAYTHRRYPLMHALRAVTGNARTGDPTRIRTAVCFRGLTVEPEHWGWQHDMRLQFSAMDERIELVVEYDASLYSNGTVEVFARHVANVAAGIPHWGSMRLLEVPLDGASESSLPIRSTPTRSGGYGPVHRAFSDIAARWPDRVALRSVDVSVTYGWLDRKTNQLAYRLRSTGARPGVAIGIFMTPSLAALMAILGVLKAGAAYVPLEPRHPNARLMWHIEDAGIERVVTTSSHRTRLPTNLDVLCVDELLHEVANECDGELCEWASPADVAYLMFTSGSTGRPKGIAVSHASLVVYLAWAEAAYVRRTPAAFALGTSLAFDLSVTAMFTPLVSGGVVVVLPDGDGEYAWQAVAEDGGIDCLKVTPSHLARAFAHALEASGIGLLVIGGEELMPELASQAHRAFGRHVHILNEYGPTEATVGCIVHAFREEDSRLMQLPIGVPIAECSAYILSGRGAPLAALEQGELFLAGPSLAYGYWNRPELTAERFLPLDSGYGNRMYRTGDLARRCPDGTLTFEGRNDGQIKFHAFRLELGELRAALNQHVEVRDSLVRVVTTGHDALLVAYYVSREPIDPDSLRALLSHSVVHETIPNLFCHLSRFPLTLNGKIDLRALPSAEEIRSRLPSPELPLQTKTQQILGAIWRDLLGARQIGRDSNFFRLGGHSLLASRMIRRAEDQLGVQIPLRTLFETPDLGSLAALVDARVMQRSSEPSGDEEAKREGCHGTSSSGEDV